MTDRFQAYFMARKMRRNDFPHVFTVMWPTPHPYALGRPLTHEAGLGTLSTDRYALLPWRGNALRQASSCLSQKIYLPLLFVHIDATICHGWSRPYRLSRWY